jgi:pyruvate formate lyase activating enzyme
LIERERCDLCGECLEVCPSKALDIWGEIMTIDDIIDVVM